MPRPRKGRPRPAGWRCEACLFPREACLCPEARRVALPFEVVIVRHASEWGRMTSTARWAALAVPGLRIVDHGLPGVALDLAALAAPGSALLYPSAAPPPAAPPARLVVPDGTWAQARRMVQRIPALRALPRLALPPPEGGVRVRQGQAGGMSTLEALAAAAAWYGAGEAAAALRALHAAGVARVLALVGRSG